MIYTLIAVAMARALMSFGLPNTKPFNCQSCLSFWTALTIYLVVDWKLVPLAFISYLISDLILIYEYK
jgi:hypothetical protein